MKSCIFFVAGVVSFRGRSLHSVILFLSKLFVGGLPPAIIWLAFLASGATQVPRAEVLGGASRVGGGEMSSVVVEALWWFVGGVLFAVFTHRLNHAVLEFVRFFWNVVGSKMGCFYARF